MPDTYVIFSAEVNAASANNFINFLTAQAAAGTTRLIMAMNCQGGQVVAGVAIYNAMMAMPYDIVTHNIGNVDSIANAIFLAGGERYACPTATFMFHSVGFTAAHGLRLEEANLKAFLDSIIADNKRVAALIAGRTNLSAGVSRSLFRQQRTRDATWARNNGLIADIRDFTYPAGGNVQMFT